MVKLFCALVGVEGDVFSIEVDENMSELGLKNAIANAIPAFIACPASNLQLWFAAKNGVWLPSDSEAALRLKNGEFPQDIRDLISGEPMKPTETITALMKGKNLPTPQLGQIHVLIKEPKRENTVDEQHEGLDFSSGKHARGDDVSIDKSFSVAISVKKRRVISSGDTVRFFRMGERALLGHPMQQYPIVMEREAYTVIFAELMDKVKFCFEEKYGANMIVKGNPGIGKSRFYLYCAYQLIRRSNHPVVQGLPSFELVMNFNNVYQKYRPETSDFINLSDADLSVLQDKPSVLRLIDGKSSLLTGWKGVSILFAVPGLEGMDSYAKANSFTYILPAWTLDELQDYNSLLSDNLKVPEDVLTSRYFKFGGVPRFIFTCTELENEFMLNQATAAVSAMDIVSHVKSLRAVGDGFLSLVLKMVPSRDDFKASFYTDFVSEYVAEKMIAKADHKALQQVTEFVLTRVGDEDSWYTFAVRSKMYTLLCHRWFNLHKQQRLQLHSLCSNEVSDFAVPGDMQTIRFSTLDEIRQVPKGWTYYRPALGALGALDAFIIDGDSLTCYSLKMTLRCDEKVDAISLREFLTWLAGVGVSDDKFNFGFVVPSALAHNIRDETSITEVSQRSGMPVNIKQFAAVLDDFRAGN